MERFAADVDSDGDMDLLIASQFDDTITWYENDGSQNFTPHTISTAADGAQSVFAADVDGDIDVLSASANDDTITWYENLGNGTATLSIDDVSQLEDGTFTITSDTAASADITVVVNTADSVGQATAGSDYTAIVNQTATIVTGNSSTTVTVTVNDDTIVEDNQTFKVNLSDAKIGGFTDAAQVVIGGGTGIGTIENNDTAVLTISDVTETETDSDFTVQATVTLSADVEGGFDVAYSSVLETADATDVTVQGSSLSYVGTACETQTLDVVIIGDDIADDDETFTITLGDVTGTSTVQDASITTGAVSDGLIINDDTAVPTTNLDVDANSEATALTDGVLIVRYLFGVTGTQLTDGALGTGALRTDAVEIIAFLDGFLPAAASASIVVST
jgi:hypothetical protein